MSILSRQTEAVGEVVLEDTRRWWWWWWLRRKAAVLSLVLGGRTGAAPRLMLEAASEPSRDCNGRLRRLIGVEALEGWKEFFALNTGTKYYDYY